MAFVTVQNSGGDPVIVRQRFVALQPIVDVVRPMLSALHTDCPSQSRKKREFAVSSKALRLPIRAQNKTATHLITIEVGMHG